MHGQGTMLQSICMNLSVGRAHTVTSYCSLTPVRIMVLPLQFIILSGGVSPFSREFSDHTAVTIGCAETEELVQLLVDNLLISSEDTVSYMYIGGKN